MAGFFLFYFQDFFFWVFVSVYINLVRLVIELVTRRSTNNEER